MKVFAVSATVMVPSFEVAAQTQHVILNVMTVQDTQTLDMADFY